MELLNRIGIRVDTYEGNSPILTHIFWGKDLSQAISYARSHLISDLFFSSTFRGEMKWKDGILFLSYNGKVMSFKAENYDMTRDVIGEIKKMAIDILDQQHSVDLDEIINDLSKM